MILNRALHIGWLALALLVCQAMATPSAELQPGATKDDWLLIIEADGERPDQDLVITPLLRQFAVGAVTIRRLSGPPHPRTRWQIPLHLMIQGTTTVPALRLGQEQTPPLRWPPSGAPSVTPTSADIAMAAKVLQQGPLYPGQPFVYQLSLWLPDNLQAAELSEPTSDHFTIRRLGTDQWLPPTGPGVPGRLIRSWLLQASAPGRYPLTAPRLQGRQPGERGQIKLVSTRANTLFITIEPPPQPLVASRLTLSQQLDPAMGAIAGEPVIRTLSLTMEGGNGSGINLPKLAHVPAGIEGRADGDQQQEILLINGTLRFERQWRQALTASAPGHYRLAAISLPWFNSQTRRIEHLYLPATWLHIKAGQRQPLPHDQRPPSDSLYWVIWALLLRTLWHHGPQWRAFYRLQRALCQGEPDEVRQSLLGWARLRWGKPCPDLASLPCRSRAGVEPQLHALARACFDPLAPPQPDWQVLAIALCAEETQIIAPCLRGLARLVS